MVHAVGRLTELWRYPVMGWGGESPPATTIDRRGVVGDRAYAVVGADGKLGSGKTTRRFRRMPGLHTMHSATVADGSVVVGTADGWAGPATDAEAARRASEVVGEPVTIAPEGDVRHFDNAAVHLVTTASLAWLAARLPDVRVDRRRFRPNLVIQHEGDDDGDELVEDAWVGAELRVGGVRLRIEERAIRCVTTALPVGGLPFAPAIPGELKRANDFCFGAYAAVLEPGVVRVGDEVALAG
jgi:uncharacterized protein YcbX